jgi:hypothetical protein
MIHHLSIPAIAPLHVAQVLAGIWGGKAVPFPPHPGSYMVLTLDEHGTLIEIYPLGTEMIPGLAQNEVLFAFNALASLHSATHAAISVRMNQKQIEQIAAREGWRCVKCDRDGFFEVIEFWVENRFLLELLTPSLASRYVEFMHPQNLAKLLNTPDLAIVG